MIPALRSHGFTRDFGYWIDQVGFPVLIGYFILIKSHGITRLAPGALESLGRILAHDPAATDGLILSRFLSEALVILYNALSLWALLTRQKPLRTSDTAAEIAVPIFTIAAYISINLLGWIPAPLNPALVPARYALSLSLAGSVFIFSGLAISTIAIFHLRRSFAVLVQVRDVVSHGLYRYVRHPVYLGYFIQIAGFLMAIPYLWTLFWAIIAGTLFIVRAKLEEKKIAMVFPAYRAYMSHTPFLWPWMKKNP